MLFWGGQQLIDMSRKLRVAEIRVSTGSLTVKDDICVCECFPDNFGIICGEKYGK